MQPDAIFLMAGVAAAGDGGRRYNPRSMMPPLFDRHEAAGRLNADKRTG
jgi:hypothetical protein